MHLGHYKWSISVHAYYFLFIMADAMCK